MQQIRIKPRNNEYAPTEPFEFQATNNNSWLYSTSSVQFELQSHPAVKKPLISRRNAEIRKQWCKERRIWTIDQWKRIVWSDESTFQLIPNSRRTVRRLPNEKYLPECVQKQMQMGGGKVTVWGAMSWYGYSPLCIIEGTVNKEKYVEILDEFLLPYIEEEMPIRGTIFQQDNATPHTASFTKTWLAQHNINVLPWPPSSPDLNIIENCWKTLGDRVSKRNPSNLNELKSFLRQEWGNMPQVMAENLVNSLPRRIKACIKAKGYFFKA